jgi:hypothetical protein
VDAGKRAVDGIWTAILSTIAVLAFGWGSGAVAGEIDYNTLANLLGQRVQALRVAQDISHAARVEDLKLKNL